MGHDICGALFLPGNREDFSRMNDELRQIKELAKYIELETENDRHSELCKLGHIISMAQKIADIGQTREEILETMN